MANRKTSPPPPPPPPRTKALGTRWVPPPPPPTSTSTTRVALVSPSPLRPEEGGHHHHHHRHHQTMARPTKPQYHRHTRPLSSPRHQPVPVTPLRQPTPQHHHNDDSHGTRNKRPPPPPPPHRKKRPAPPPNSCVNHHKRFRPSSSSFHSCRNLKDLYQTGDQIGQGTFGSVFVATHKGTGQAWALKRINTTEKDKGEGISVTAMREVKLLNKLQHPNIIRLKEVVSSSQEDQSDAEEGKTTTTTIPHPRYNFFLVLEYLEYDLAGILYTPEIQYTLDHVRSWSYQLLQGVSYLHQQHILHRDLKPANLLINRRTGAMKIADFGLSISTNNTDSNNTSSTIPLTNMVQSLWYRAPELLLHCYKYDNKIDMYSVGLILAELFCRRPLFPGTDETNQIQMVWSVLGQHHEQQQQQQQHKPWPTKESCRKTPPPPQSKQTTMGIVQFLRQRLPSRSQLQWMNENDSAAVHLITQLLQVDPTQRHSAQEALQSNFFCHNHHHHRGSNNNKLDMTSGGFARFQTIHEQDCRNRRRKQKQQQQQQQQQQEQQQQQQNQSHKNNNVPAAQQKKKTTTTETGYVNRLLCSLKKKHR